LHELSIASAILDRVRAESARHGGVHVCKVGIKLGELSGVDADALSFGIEALVKDTPLEPLALEVEYCPRRQRCTGCGCDFAAANSETGCPKCGNLETVCTGGRELDLAFMEVEDA